MISYFKQKHKYVVYVSVLNDKNIYQQNQVQDVMGSHKLVKLLNWWETSKQFISYIHLIFINDQVHATDQQLKF